MWEFLVVIVSFLSIPLLNKKKIQIGIAICICAVLMAFLGGLGLLDIKEVIFSTFFDMTKVERYIVVLEIGILGVLLKEYKIIDEVIRYIVEVIKNKKIVLMSIPALVGLLSVPGGAIISVPFVDKLGDESNLSSNQKAIVNLIYRHIAMHILPYTIGFLVVTSLVPQISIYKFIGFNFIFVILYVTIGYFLYLRKVENNNILSANPVLPNLLKLLIYTAPVYLAVLLNMFFHIPFYIGIIANLLVIYFLRPRKTFFRDIARAFNIRILLALIGVYLIQGVIGKIESISSLLSLIFNNPRTIMLGIIFTSFFFGLTTGFQPTALGVVLPILITLPISESQLLLYCHFTFMWSFLGYFFSPLHLCQLFTCEYLKISTIDLYKDYWKFFLYLVALLIIDYFILGLLLK
ncbi:MAG: DUF401 family protein [Atribacterota bacterium]|nr:DUF401 family protein [Atribacterota bacterium]MDD5636957.1 DUF401 family protein [Atribacterota bacterium]